LPAPALSPPLKGAMSFHSLFIVSQPMTVPWLTTRCARNAAVNRYRWRW